MLELGVTYVREDAGEANELQATANIQLRGRRSTSTNSRRRGAREAAAGKGLTWRTEGHSKTRDSAASNGSDESGLRVALTAFNRLLANGQRRTNQD
eukprot:6200985-Pleurochrysis_carterae.AAC.4